MNFAQMLMQTVRPAPTGSALKVDLVRRFLSNGPKTTTEIAEELGLTVRAMSRHLSVMRDRAILSKVRGSNSLGRIVSYWSLAH